MFETRPRPAVNDPLPDDWPLLLPPGPAPEPGASVTAGMRSALVGLQGGTWCEAVVWAWTWNATGRPVQWRCQIEVAGIVHWYYHDDRLLRLM